MDFKVIFVKVIHFNGDFQQSDAVGNFWSTSFVSYKVIFDEVIIRHYKYVLISYMQAFP
jgi:hypothetical protein